MFFHILVIPLIFYDSLLCKSTKTKKSIENMNFIYVEKVFFNHPRQLWKSKKTMKMVILKSVRLKGNKCRTLSADVWLHNTKHQVYK